MAFLFMGNEDTDFVMPIYDWFWAGYNARTQICRGSIAVYGTQSAVSLDGPLSAPTNNFWFTTRFLFENAATGGGRPFAFFSDGNNRRIDISLDNTCFMRVFTYNDAGVRSELTNSLSNQVLQPSTLVKLDANISYSATGFVRLYINQQLVFSYTGNTIASGGTSTAVNKMSLTNPHTQSNYYFFFSETVVAERDSRSLSLYSLIPNANGSGNQWNGTYQDIDETPANAADAITTAAADQTAYIGLSDLPTGSNYTVQAIRVVASATRGTTGPTNLQIGVRQGGVTSLSANKTLDTSWTKVSEVMEINPNTGLAWTTAEINAMEFAARSKT